MKPLTPGAPPSSLARRQCAQEWMDDPDADPDQLARALRFIQRVNHLLGYTRATLSHLKSFSRAWRRGKTVRILDLATGSADVPLAIARWARRRGHDVRIIGLELHPGTIQAARRATGSEPRIAIVRADALAIPFADSAFDYSISGMFLHHLSEAQQLQLLGEMDRVASRGIVVADLLRNRRAYRWISLLTLMSNRMIRHDARVSVAQALNEPEALALRDAVGLPYLIFHHHFGHRFVLAGEKVGKSSPRLDR